VTPAWAVIPIAGRGTRLYPAAVVVPKALLPVGPWPMLHGALDECLRAEIGGIVLVMGPDQALVHAYLDEALAAARRDDTGDLADLGRGLLQIDLVRVEQRTPAGVGDAFMLGRPITGEGSFAVLLPDNWFDAEPAAIAQVARAYEITGCCAVGLTEVVAEEAHLFGNVGGMELELVADGTYRVAAIQDKLPGQFPAVGEPVLRGCARYVVDGRFYDALLATGPPENGEWDDVPAFQRLIATEGLAAQRIIGQHYDVGHPAGYLAAAAYLAR
jgi:UTP--glucose-1-phosphate uridylyltransferase